MLQWNPRLSTILLLVVLIAAIVALTTGIEPLSVGWGE